MVLTESAADSATPGARIRWTLRKRRKR
jgi:hypothetical protein